LEICEPLSFLRVGALDVSLSRLRARRCDLSALSLAGDDSMIFPLSRLRARLILSLSGLRARLILSLSGMRAGLILFLSRLRTGLILSLSRLRTGLILSLSPACGRA
jgi:hypothetical protein